MSVPIQPAATVMLLRETSDGAQVLMLKRSNRLAFGPGIWVFPGGRVDSEDCAPGADAQQAARVAAVREAAEEAGVQVAHDQLVYFAHWTTPEGPPRRFATWFFTAALQGEQQVTLDEEEIKDYFWAHPAEVLQRHAQGELELYEPTWMSLNLIVNCKTLEEMQRTLAQTPCETYQGRMVALPDGGTCHLYDGDAAYENLDLDAPGSRRRLWALGSGWRYEHTEHTSPQGAKGG